MPWSNGIFTLLPVSHAEPGTQIRAEQQNGPHEDFAAGLNNCLTRDGSTTMLANLPMNGRKVVNLAAGTNPADAVRLDQLPASSAWLEAVAALTMAADRFPYATGPEAAALATLTAFARTLLDDADAATARATLGLLALATKDKAAISDIEATGSPNADTYLRGDGTWSIPTQYTWMSPQNLSGLAEVDFSGIPSGVNDILVDIKGASLNANGSFALVLGTNEGLQSTGYDGMGITLASNYYPWDTKIRLGSTITEPNAASGIVVMRRMRGLNEWSIEGSIGGTGNHMLIFSGRATLPSRLTDVRFSRETASLFDAGSVSIGYRK